MAGEQDRTIVVVNGDGSFIRFMLRDAVGAVKRSVAQDTPLPK